MKVRITPSKLKGSIKAVASKSQAHRLLICAGLADAPTDIFCGELSQDIEATVRSMRALGSGISYDPERKMFHVEPVDRGVNQEVSGEAVVDVGESGSTLRFLLPVICALGRRARVVMGGRLPGRPLSPLWEELTEHGAVLKRDPDGSVEIRGRLSGGGYSIAADVSSQFISGLLFALPLIKESGKELSVRLIGDVESRNYILMTMDALDMFGIGTVWDGDRIVIKKGGGYTSPGAAEVEGDWSNGAFWICAGCLEGNELTVTGLNENSAQGDRAVLAVSERVTGGERARAVGDVGTNRNGGIIRGVNSIIGVTGGLGFCGGRNGESIEIDVRDIPDLVPALSVLAAGVRGDTAFSHAGRLRIKESDRIKTTAEMINNLGGRAVETADGLIIEGSGGLRGGEVDSANDHRIAMSAAVASCICENEVIINGAEAVRKSYPDFWEDFKSLGGAVAIEG